VKELLAEYWSEENPESPCLPWGAAEAGVVGAFLRANPTVTIGVIAQCLNNRLVSDDHAPGEGIYRWFRDVLRYHSAPLDRFRLPKRPTAEATVGYRLDDGSAEAQQWFLERARRRKANGEKLDDVDKVVLAGEGEL
jgi:hypothetical protein